MYKKVFSQKELASWDNFFLFFLKIIQPSAYDNAEKIKTFLGRMWLIRKYYFHHSFICTCSCTLPKFET